jgi:hypothetical protein
MKKVQVPKEFKPLTHPFMPSPPHQIGSLIEPYFDSEFKKEKPELDVFYLPIYWTNYYVNRNHNTDQRLTQFLCTLNKDYKYFTIIQHAKGLLDKFPARKNVFVFSSGSIGDYCIPLVSDDRDIDSCQKDLLASFMGNIKVHKIREEMADALEGHKDVKIVNTNQKGGIRSVGKYNKLMCRSKFALCPRGFGVTSWRLYESIQMGVVPVYIYDKKWLAFEDQLDWSEFCVLIERKDVGDTYNILKEISENKYLHMCHKLKEVYSNYMSMESVYKKVIELVKKRNL